MGQGQGQQAKRRQGEPRDSRLHPALGPAAASIIWSLTDMRALLQVSRGFFLRAGLPWPAHPQFILG